MENVSRFIRALAIKIAVISTKISGFVVTGILAKELHGSLE